MGAAKGIAIRPSNQPFRVDAVFPDAQGNPITTGTATCRISEIETDGTLRALDFNPSPPTVGATAATVPTTATLNLTNQSAGGLARVYWSATFAATNLTIGGVYLIEFQPPAGATIPNPTLIQFGSADGDAAPSTTGVVPANVTQIASQTANASGAVTFPTGTIGTSTYAGGAVASVAAPVTVNAVNGQSPPTNWSAMVLDTNGRVQVQPGTATGQINLNVGNLAGPVPSVTGAVGSVTGGVGGNVTVGGYSTGQDPATLMATAGYTGARASKLDNLDTNVGSRLAAGAYSAPTLTQIAALLPANFVALGINASGQYLATALVNAPVSAAAPTTSAIAAAVWSDLTSGGDFATAGSIGALAKTLTPSPTNYQQSGQPVMLPTTPPAGYGGGSGSGLVLTQGTISAATSPSSFTIALGVNASGNPASYTNRKVFFQGGTANQQRGAILSATISGTAGAYVLTAAMNPAISPAIQVTPAVGDTLEIY